MGRIRSWLRDSLPWLLRGAAGGLWLGAIWGLINTPHKWYWTPLFVALGGVVYSIAVTVQAVVKHHRLMAAKSVWIPKYQLKGKVLKYDRTSELYHVWTPGHSAVSSGCFRADDLEPLDVSANREEV